MELTEKEAHCVARLLQGAIYGDTLWRGCEYCKYQCRRFLPKKSEPHTQNLQLQTYESLLARLTQETGVDLGSAVDIEYVKHGFFPVNKFLINSNDEIKEYMRKSLDNYAKPPYAQSLENTHKQNAGSQATT